MAIRSVTIKLTDKQRSMLRSLTGEDHGEIRFETAHAPAEPLASKAALRSRTAMAKKLAGRKAMAKKLAGRKAMAKKLAGRKSMARKSAMRIMRNHNQVAIN